MKFSEPPQKTESPNEANAISPESLAQNLPEPENKIFYPGLDGLRAVAVLLVFAHHYLTINAPPAVQWGWTGVDIFFVLSGFLITGILFDTRNQLHRVKNFYARRSLRIFPLYYGLLLLLLLSTPIFHWTWNHQLLFFGTYVGNFMSALVPGSAAGVDSSILLSSTGDQQVYFGPYWSLCVEEQFYLIWPCIVFLVRDRVRLRNICLAIVIAEPFLRATALFLLPAHLLQAGVLYCWTPFRLDALLCGGLLALMLRGPEAAWLMRSAHRLFYLIAVLFASAWVFSGSMLHQGYGASWSVPWIPAVGFSIVDLLAAATLLLAINPGTLVSRVLALGPLRKLGQLSYGFYVFHYLFLSLFRRAFLRHLAGVTHQTTVPVAVAGFLVTLALSYLSFRFFEAPILRFKSRFSDTREAA